MKPLLIGGFLLAACAPKISEPSAERLELGERTYQKCYSCHALEPGKNDLTGPTLHKIIGRKIAAEPGFDYSPALRRYGVQQDRWDQALLDKFIADPEKVVPGTAMTFNGISNIAEREALIAYLMQDQTRASADRRP